MRADAMTEKIYIAYALLIGCTQAKQNMHMQNMQPPHCNTSSYTHAHSCSRSHGYTCVYVKHVLPA